MPQLTPELLLQIAALILFIGVILLFIWLDQKHDLVQIISNSLISFPDQAKEYTPLQINGMRGIFIIMLVSYHVVGVDGNSGLKVGDGYFRVITDYLDFLRMPLIAAIGGFVYGLKPPGPMKLFVWKKFARLIIPMLVVGTIYALVQRNTFGVNRPPIKLTSLHFYPVDHYWFLISLFWVFLLVYILDSLRLLSTPYRFVVAIGLVLAVYFNISITYALGIQGFLYLLPYFLLGLAIERFEFLKKVCQCPIIVVLMLMLAILCMFINGEPHTFLRNTALFVIAGVSLVIVMFWLGSLMSSRVLAFIGKSSFVIYLYHIFFTASTRIALMSYGYAPEQYKWLHIVSALSAAFIGSIVLEFVISRNKLSSLLFMGTIKHDPSKLSGEIKSFLEYLKNKLAKFYSVFR